MLIIAVWIVEHQVDLFAALGTGGAAGGVGAGIISFFKRRGQSAIDALDAALPGKLAVPPKMKATLREIDKQGYGPPPGVTKSGPTERDSGAPDSA